MRVLLWLTRAVLVVGLASVLVNTVMLTSLHLAGALPSVAEILILAVVSVWGALRITRGVRRQLRVADAAHPS